MKQHLFKTLHQQSLAGMACAAVGLVLMITASPALAQDGQHMMGDHAQGMMGNATGQAMMGSDHGQGMMNGHNHRQGMMGADGHMMGSDNYRMMSNDHGMRGRDDQ
jgi:hypothetical protein